VQDFGRVVGDHRAHSTAVERRRAAPLPHRRAAV
jgi:hypothetical protein